MRKLIFLFVILGTLAAGVKAQTLTVAGGNTATDRHIPIFGQFINNQQRSHMLYPANLLTDMVGSHITGLTYYFYITPSGAWGAWEGIQVVRMGITTASDLQNGLDNAPVTTVWTGTLSNCISGLTMVVTLDEPFPYTGGNLLIEFENLSGVTPKDSHFYGESQTAQLSYMTYSSPVSTYTYGAAFLPKTTFAFESGCFAPTHTQATNIGVETALLRWDADPILPASSYTVAFKIASDTIFTEVTTTDTFLNLTGLQISTHYDWKVRSHCDTSGMSDWSMVKTFTTLQHPATLPYQCGFEDNVENLEWGFSQKNTNQWHIGEAMARNGESSLYISNNGGESNAYSLTRSSVAWTYRDILFTPGHSRYQISFDYKGMGENGQDNVKVFLGPRATPSGSAAPAGTVQLDDALSMVHAWRHYSFTVDSSFAGDQRLYFRWVNNDSDGTNPPAAIDNIRVETLDCDFPIELTLLSVTDSSATVSWNAVPGATAGYEVAYHLASDTNYLTVTTMDTFCVLSGLQSFSEYLWMVKTRCSATNQSAWSSDAIFVTQVTIAQVPYFCGFEDAVENNNWQFINGTDVNKWCIGTAAHTLGEMGMYITDDNGEHNNYSPPNSFSVWAYRDIYIDSTLNDVLLTFDYRNANVLTNSARVFMGPPSTLPSGNNVPENAMQLGSSLTTAYNEWKSAYYMLDSTQRGLQRLYFLFYRSSNSYHFQNQPFAIDNITVVESHCLYPIERSVASLDSTTALLTWSTPLTGQPNSYTVAYKQNNETDFTSVTVTDTFVLLTGLEYSTHYVWKVRSNCSASEIGDWSPELSFLSAPIALPYCCCFEDSTDNAQWQFIALDTNTQWYIGQTINNGGTSSLYVSSDDGTTTSCYHPNYYSVYTLAYRDLYFHHATDYLISFDVKESSCDSTSLVLAIGQPAVQVSVDEDTGIPSGSNVINIFNSNYSEVSDSVWQHYDFIIDSSYTGARRIYLIWYDSGNAPCSPTAAVDNFCVSANNCGRPNALDQLMVTNTLAELSWRPYNNQTAESYTVAYRKETDTIFTEVVVTDTTCIIGGLQPLTGYVWKVRANCGASEYSFWSNEADFHTEQPLPYFCDFEDTLETVNWQYYPPHYANTNHVWIGDAVACGVGHSLYNTIDNGVTNSYAPSGLASEASRNIYFNPGYPKYQISFDCKGGGSMQGFMQVGLDGTPISGYLSEADFWTHHNIVVDSSYAGLHQLTLKFDYHTTWNPAGAFDNISIKGVFHETPVGLSTSDITAHTAHLSWTCDSSETSLSYRLAWRAQSDTTYTEILLSASDSAYLLSNLDASSWYVWRVKALYASNEWSEWSSEKAFQTLAQLPYSCDFEDNTENKNWTIRDGDYYFTTGSSSTHYQASHNKWFIGTPSDVADNQLLFISSDDGITNSYTIDMQSFVWAFRDIYLEPGHSQYQLSLDFKGIGETGQDYVRLYLDTPEEPSHNHNATVTLTQIGEDLNLTDQWVHKSITVDSTHAGAQRLYILWNNNYDFGTNPPAAIDNISIKVATCGVPYNMVSYPQDTSATLSWSSESAGIASSYILAYKMLNDSVYTILTTQDTTLTVQGLIPNTDYIWHVRSICSASDTSEWSGDALFTTTQMLLHLPYLCSFDNSAENSHWAIVNGISENQWVIGNATGYDDNHALYISNDSSATNAYTITSTSSVWAYRDVYFDENHLAYQLSFDYKGMGQNTTDYMQVFVGTPAIPSGTTIPSGAVQLGGQFFDVNDWAHYAFTLDATHTGVQRIYFQWVNNNTRGNQPPAAVDNLSVCGLSCITPSDLAIVDVTATEATLNWSPSPLSQAAYYSVSVRLSGSTTTTEYTTADTFLLITGLNPSKTYYCKVRAHCSGNEHSEWSSDLCVQIPATLPYICDFEDSDERKAWQTVNGNYINQWYIGNAVNNGGDYSLYISNDGGISNAFTQNYNTANISYVWAYRDIYFDPSDSAYTLSFDFRGAGGTGWQQSSYANVYIGTPTIPNGSTVPDGLTTLGTSLCGMPAWTTKTYTLDHSHAGLQRLYFFWRNNGYSATNPPAAIDNITIDGTPCNHVPSNLTAYAIDTMATLLWTLPNGSADYYTIAYKSQSDSDYTYLTTHNEQVSLGNLNPLTTFTWKVRAHCTATDYSFWSTEASFQTATNTAHIPYSYDFEDSVENANWTIENNSYTNKWIIGNAVSNGGTNSLYVSNDNGLSNAYTVNAQSYVWAYRDFYFVPGAPDYQISFDIRSYGELYYNNPYDFVKVFLGPPATPPTYSNSGSDLPSGATQLGAEFLNDSVWHTVSFTVDSTHGGPQRLYFLWENDNVYGTNPPGAVDNIQISYSGCPIPVQLATVTILDDAATLTWHADADTFIVAFRSLQDSAYTEVTTTETTYQMSNLEPSSFYRWKVRALCTGGESSVWSAQDTFTTLPQLGRIPYAHGFENAEENSHWTTLSYYGNTDWFIGHAAYQSGDSALYISNDNGVSNAYTNTVVSYCWAYRDFYFDPDYSGYEISFDYRVQGAADYAGMKVFIGPPTTPVDYATPTGAVQLGGSFYGHPTWTHFTFTADTTFKGLNRLYFLWSYDWGDGSNPPAAVDNISIQGGNCGVPVHITTDTVTAHTISIHFSPSSPADSLWEAVIVPHGSPFDPAQSITLSDTAYTFQNLVNNIEYDIYLRALCGSEASYWTQPFTVITDCGYISVLPYFDNFDTYGSETFPRCWHRLNSAYGNCPYIYLYTPGSYDHTYSTPGMMVLGTPSGTYNIATLPEIDHAIPVNELQLTFQYKTNDPNDKFIIGVMSDPEDAATFVPVDTVQAEYHAVEQWAEKKVHLHNYTGNGHFVALRHEAPSLNIDNVLLERMPCPLPHDISVTSITNHSADIDWVAEDGETSWQVVVKPHELPLSQAVPITVTTKPYHIDNLILGKWYEVYVKADCGNGESSDWSMPESFITDCASIATLPYVEDFENYFQPWYYNEFARPRCWTFPHTDWAYPDIFFPETANIQDIHYYVGNSHSLWFRTENSGAMLMAVMPQLDVELHDVRASFKMLAESDYSGHLEVGVLNSETDESSFELVRTIQAGEIVGAWTDEVIDFDLTVISGTGNHIAFRYYAWSTSWYMWMDDLTINYIHPTDTDTVGVSQYQLDELVEVYPNPTSNHITVRYASSPIHDVEVSDMYGKLQARIPVNDYRVDVNLSSFASGVYFVRVTTDQGVVTKRIVKL